MQHADVETMHATVRGRVQGVGFRAFVEDCARLYNLAGYVRNMQDGSVYVHASGPRYALDRLVAELRKGPPMARVDAVELDWAQNDTTVEGRFEVRA